MSAASNGHDTSDDEDKSKKGSTAVRSPCIDVCILNAENICEGCYRTVKEIQGWSRMSAEEQGQTLTKTWQRARAAGNVL